MRTGDWVKMIVCLVVIVGGLFWAVYFYTHMSTVCHWSLMVGSRECMGYSLSRIH